MSASVISVEQHHGVSSRVGIRCPLHSVSESFGLASLQATFDECFLDTHGYSIAFVTIKQSVRLLVVFYLLEDLRIDGTWIVYLAYQLWAASEVVLGASDAHQTVTEFSGAKLFHQLIGLLLDQLGLLFLVISSRVSIRVC